MLWWLLVGFQFKHFLCDWPLQRHGNRKGAADWRAWVLDLGEHSLVHALGTFLLCACLDVKKAAVLAAVDFLLHFTVDRVKAAPHLGGQWKPAEKMFWVALGVDQLAHHLINLAFAWWMTRS